MYFRVIRELCISAPFKMIGKKYHALWAGMSTVYQYFGYSNNGQLQYNNTVLRSANIVLRCFDFLCRVGSIITLFSPPCSTLKLSISGPHRCYVFLFRVTLIVEVISAFIMNIFFNFRFQNSLKSQWFGYCMPVSFFELEEQNWFQQRILDEPIQGDPIFSEMKLCLLQTVQHDDWKCVWTVWGRCTACLPKLMQRFFANFKVMLTQLLCAVSESDSWLHEETMSSSQLQFQMRFHCYSAAVHWEPSCLSLTRYT